MKTSIPFEKHHLEFLSDPERAQAYLEVALEEYARDQDTSAFLLALKDIAALKKKIATDITEKELTCSTLLWPL